MWTNQINKSIVWDARHCMHTKIRIRSVSVLLWSQRIDALMSLFVPISRETEKWGWEEPNRGRIAKLYDRWPNHISIHKKTQSSDCCFRSFVLSLNVMQKNKIASTMNMFWFHSSHWIVYAHGSSGQMFWIYFWRLDIFISELALTARGGSKLKQHSLNRFIVFAHNRSEAKIAIVHSMVQLNEHKTLFLTQ